jgi:hypothetical protein
VARTTSGAITKFESGGYSVSLAGVGDQWVSSKDMPTGSAIEVEVSASVLRGSLKAAGGVACVSADGASFYSFLVDDAGNYWVYAHPGGGDSPPITGKPSPAARTGQLAANRVAATCVSEGSRVHLMMSINGTTVYDSVDAPPSASPWRGGLAICTCHGSGDILFQNITQQRLP